MSELQTRGQSHDKTNWKLVKFNLFVISVLDKLPFLKRLAAYCFYNMRILKYKWGWRKQTKLRDSALDIHKIIWINPNRIEYTSLIEFDPWKYRGAVIEGDWDQLEKRFNNMDVYVAFKERVTRGIFWEDTAFYQRILNAINNGYFVWNCRSETDLKKRCANLDNLLERIRNDGYKTQSEIVAAKTNGEHIRMEEEICVNVGRYGDIIFNDGAHRLAIAKVIGIDKIPMEIAVRHPEWIRFRKDILQNLRDSNETKLPFPITHPDLQDIPFLPELVGFDIIESNLSTNQGKVLDIGDQWGYYCHRFEDKGFECYAAEVDEANMYFLVKLKRSENRSFTAINDSILNWSDAGTIHFDIVLAFSVFHHFLRTKDTHDKLASFLNNLDMKEMYFQTSISTEMVHPDAYTNYNEDDFVNFIIQNSRLNSFRQIGEARDGSKIFKLS